MGSLFVPDPTFDYNSIKNRLLTERFPLLHKDLSSYFKECLVVHGANLIPYNLEEFTSEIVQTSQSRSNKKILFEQRREGSQTTVRQIINDIVTRLIKSHNFKLSDFAIMNGSFPSEYNANLLKKYVEKNNLLPIETFFANTMETQFLHNLHEQNIKNILDYKFDYNKKIKKFLLHIGKCNTHRIYILSHLMRSNLLSDSHYSCYFENHHLQNMSAPHFAPHLRESIEHIKSLGKSFPIKLHSDDDFASLSMWGLKREEKFHYDDSFFAIVPETNFYHIDQNNYEFHNMIDQVFITEKTYRMIAGKLPFILVSFTKSLECLRESGYKTFHPYIDETYDQIDDDELRLEAIIREIKRLCSFSSSEWAMWSESIMPIVEHNQKTLLSCTPKYIQVY